MDGGLTHSHRYLTGGGTGVVVSECHLLSPDKVASLVLTTVLAAGTLMRAVCTAAGATRGSGPGKLCAPGYVDPDGNSNSDDHCGVLEVCTCRPYK